MEKLPVDLSVLRASELSSALFPGGNWFFARISVKEDMDVTLIHVSDKRPLQARKEVSWTEPFTKITLSTFSSRDANVLITLYRHNSLTGMETEYGMAEIRLWELLGNPTIHTLQAVCKGKTLGTVDLRMAALDLTQGLYSSIEPFVEPKSSAPVFHMLADTLENMIESRHSSMSCHRLARTHLGHFRYALAKHWAAQREANNKEEPRLRVDTAHLVNNPLDDLMHQIHFQILFMKKIWSLPVMTATTDTTLQDRMRKHSASMLDSIAQAAAMLLRWSRAYIASTPGTIMSFGGGKDAVNKLYDEHNYMLIIRVNMLRELGLGLDISSAQTEQEMIGRLFEESIREPRDNETNWPLTSITSMVGCLRGRQANTLHRLIRERLQKYRAQGTPSDRDFLRRLMMHVAQRSRVLPSYLDYKDDIHVRKEEQKLNRGSFGDVWKGSIVRLDDRRYVAVKVLRAIGDTPREKLFAEVVNCWSLRHTNVLPLLGITYKYGPLSLIFPWMEHGQAPVYLRKMQTEGVSGLTTMSNKWLRQIAGGLEYIHCEGIAHGDLRGPNILVDSKDSAVIGDFGLSINANGHSLNYNSTRAGNPAWTAPELQVYNEAGTSRPTRASDIFSFALLCIQLYSGLDPWRGVTIEQDGYGSTIRKGKRPLRPLKPDSPSELMDGLLWKLVQDCWAQEPQSRPSAETLAIELRKISPE